MPASINWNSSDRKLQIIKKQNHKNARSEKYSSLTFICSPSLVQATSIFAEKVVIKTKKMFEFSSRKIAAIYFMSGQCKSKVGVVVPLLSPWLHVYSPYSQNTKYTRAILGQDIHFTMSEITRQTQAEQGSQHIRGKMTLSFSTFPLTCWVLSLYPLTLCNWW